MKIIDLNCVLSSYTSGTMYHKDMGYNVVQGTQYALGCTYYYYYQSEQIQFRVDLAHPLVLQFFRFKGLSKLYSATNQ